LPFCCWWTTNQRSGHFIPMYTERRFQQFRSRALRQRQLRSGKTGTVQRHNGTAKRQRQNDNAMAETRHNLSAALLLVLLQLVLLDVTPVWRIATILLCVLRLDAPKDGSTYQINSVSVSFFYNSGYFFLLMRLFIVALFSINHLASRYIHCTYI